MKIFDEDHIKHRHHHERYKRGDQHSGDLNVAHGLPERPAIKRQRNQAAYRCKHGHVPDGPDDGTIAPWVVLASLPFAPEIVIRTIKHMAGLNIGVDLRWTGGDSTLDFLDRGKSRYGFKPSFNQTFEVPDSPTGWWVTPYHFGVDQGPISLMIENYRTGLIWSIMLRSPCIVHGLRSAGFEGGWLEG